MLGWREGTCWAYGSWPGALYTHSHKRRLCECEMREPLPLYDSRSAGHRTGFTRAQRGARIPLTSAATRAAHSRFGDLQGLVYVAQCGQPWRVARVQTPNAVTRPRCMGGCSAPPEATKRRRASARRVLFFSRQDPLQDCGGPGARLRTRGSRAVVAGWLRAAARSRAQPPSASLSPKRYSAVARGNRAGVRVAPRSHISALLFFRLPSVATAAHAKTSFVSAAFVRAVAVAVGVSG
ncbi:LAMI_0F12266g1_1 [Lachancea mirantina]|uniref:LAMI_0F12266g1_1 n=1 Tax=Lachancea mirantina TaxID=1230905 RepID=A0A1G4K342_9SACH|nr:LAMI_0F12266g1_1 [Lachancea mirantina]